MILEPPAPHHSITQTRKCMGLLALSGFHAFRMILEPQAPNHSSTQGRKFIELHVFRMIPEAHHSISQTRKCMEFFACRMIMEPPAPHHSIAQTRQMMQSPPSPLFANCENPYISIHFQRNSEGFQCFGSCVPAMPCTTGGCAGLCGGCAR